MPDHEMWVRWNGEALWTNVLALEAQGLACLVMGGTAPSYWPVCVDSLAGSVSRSRVGWSSVAGGLLITGKGQSWGDPNSKLAPNVPIGYLCEAEFGPIPLPDQRSISAGQALIQGVRLTDTGQLQTWTGSSATQYLGRPSVVGGVSVAGSPTSVDARTYRAIATASNGKTTFALTTDGDIYTFGREFGWAIDGATYSGINASPVASLLGEDIQSINVSDHDAVAVDGSGHLWQLGYYDRPGYSYGWSGWTESSVVGTTFDQAVAANASLFALDSEGNLWGWGYTDPSGTDLDWNWVSSPTEFSSSGPFARIDSSPVHGWMGILDASGQAYYPGDGEAVLDESVPISAAYYDGADVIGTDGTWWTWSLSDQAYIDQGLPPTKEPPTPQVDCGSSS